MTSVSISSTSIPQQKEQLQEKQIQDEEEVVEIGPGALIPVIFPNREDPVSLAFINNILHCNLDQTYKATKDILLNYKRKLERYSFKQLFKSNFVWVRRRGEKGRVMYGQVTKLVSVILSVQSTVEDLEIRQQWTHLCMQLLTREVPDLIQQDTQVFVPHLPEPSPPLSTMSFATLPGNIRQGRQECIMAPDPIGDAEYENSLIAGGNGSRRNSRGSTGTRRSNGKKNRRSNGEGVISSDSRQNSRSSSGNSGREIIAAIISQNSASKSDSNGVKNNKRKRSSRGSSVDSGSTIRSCGNTVWESAGLQLISDDIARLLGLDVRSIGEMCNDRYFAKGLPAVTSDDLTVLRGPKNMETDAQSSSTIDDVPTSELSTNDS